MTDRSAYFRIAQKTEEQEPHTAPKAEDGSFHEAFIRYLEILYTHEEAEIVQHLNHIPYFSTPEETAKVSNREMEYVEPLLTNLHARDRVIGLEGMYCLPPIPLLVNITNFYPEMKDGDVEAAKLYQDYFIKGGFFRRYESSKKGTSMARVIPIEKAIEPGQKVLTAEEAHDYILNHSADELTLVPCPCRTREEKLGHRECKDKFPVAYCIMMGIAANHFEAAGMGKKVTRQEAIRYFDEMQELGMVGQTLNAEYGDMLICLCCGCCCSQTRGRIKWGNPDALSPSNFIPKVGDDCVQCETCVDRCLFEALALDEISNKIQVEIDNCVGCGVCTLACPEETLKLYRFERSTTFKTSQSLFDTVAVENREE